MLNRKVVMLLPFGQIVIHVVCVCVCIYIYIYATEFNNSYLRKHILKLSKNVTVKIYVYCLLMSKIAS